MLVSGTNPFSKVEISKTNRGNSAIPTIDEPIGYCIKTVGELSLESKRRSSSRSEIDFRQEFQQMQFYVLSFLSN